MLTEEQQRVIEGLNSSVAKAIVTGIMSRQLMIALFNKEQNSTPELDSVFVMLCHLAGILLHLGVLSREAMTEKVALNAPDMLSIFDKAIDAIDKDISENYPTVDELLKK